eukprot:scaffold200708_cov32-Tisochrysis_lutea.AAC.2
MCAYTIERRLLACSICLSQAYLIAESYGCRHGGLSARHALKGTEQAQKQMARLQFVKSASCP